MSPGRTVSRNKKTKQLKVQTELVISLSQVHCQGLLPRVTRLPLYCCSPREKSYSSWTRCCDYYADPVQYLGEAVVVGQQRPVEPQPGQLGRPVQRSSAV